MHTQILYQYSTCCTCVLRYDGFARLLEMRPKKKRRKR